MSALIQRRSNKESGLIKTILLIVVALIVLGYLGFNIRTIINSPVVSDNLHYAKEVAVNVWTMYLRSIVMFFWDIIVILISKVKDLV